MIPSIENPENRLFKFLNKSTHQIIFSEATEISNKHLTSAKISIVITIKYYYRVDSYNLD
jgi:hypothetical protein